MHCIPLVPILRHVCSPAASYALFCLLHLLCHTQVVWWYVWTSVLPVHSQLQWHYISQAVFHAGLKVTVGLRGFKPEAASPALVPWTYHWASLECLSWAQSLTITSWAHVVFIAWNMVVEKTLSTQFNRKVEVQIECQRFSPSLYPGQLWQV